ncbi:MAG: bifunctional 4-hydroxy-2-oxoglutarate aldolase/2-dehydro-3-deoxy-phosphogluconate aldolase [bacterium]
MSHTDVLHAVTAQRLIAIVRAGSAGDALEIGSRLLAAGVRAVEVSLVTPDALDVIRALVGLAPSGAYIGVGTALTAHDVQRADAAGARFVVSPGLSADVVRATREQNLISVPGAATVTEALTARDLGAHLVKIFPASTWSPGAVRDVLASLPGLPLVPTGGISLDSAPEWIAAGASAVGLGGALTKAAAGPDDMLAGLLRRLAAPD